MLQISTKVQQSNEKGGRTAVPEAVTTTVKTLDTMADNCEWTREQQVRSVRLLLHKHFTDAKNRNDQATALPPVAPAATGDKSNPADDVEMMGTTMRFKDLGDVTPPQAATPLPFPPDLEASFDIFDIANGCGPTVTTTDPMDIDVTRQDNGVAEHEDNDGLQVAIKEERMEEASFKLALLRQQADHSATTDVGAPSKQSGAAVVAEGQTTLKQSKMHAFYAGNEGNVFSLDSVVEESGPSGGDNGALECQVACRPDESQCQRTPTAATPRQQKLSRRSRRRNQQSPSKIS